MEKLVEKNSNMFWKLFNLIIKKNSTSTIYIKIKIDVTKQNSKLSWKKYKDPRLIRKIIKSAKTQLQGLI